MSDIPRVICMDVPLTNEYFYTCVLDCICNCDSRPCLLRCLHSLVVECSVYREQSVVGSSPTLPEAAIFVWKKSCLRCRCVVLYCIVLLCYIVLLSMYTCICGAVYM